MGSIGNVASLAAATSTFVIGGMAVGALMRDRNPQHYGKASDTLTKSLPLAFAGIGTAFALTSFAMMPDGAAAAVVATIGIGSAILGIGAAGVSGAVIGHKLLDH